MGEEATEDEMVVWYHQLNGQEFQQTPGDSDDRSEGQPVMQQAVHAVTKSQT